MKIPSLAILSFLVMVGNVNAQQNSVYVEQIGSGSTINFTQTGVGNAIGNPTTKATVNGNNNNVTVEQIGNTNLAALNVQADSVNISATATGDGNSVSINCGVTGSCDGSTITNTITGDGNTVTTSVKAANPSLSDEQFKKALDAIAKGKYTIEQLKASYSLTKEQEAQL